jgi:hypothetical protein
MTDDDDQRAGAGPEQRAVSGLLLSSRLTAYYGSTRQGKGLKMKHSLQTQKQRRLAIFGFLALVILPIGNLNPLAVQKDAQAGWRVEIEEGKTARSTLAISNRCSTLHHFSIDSKIEYLRFELPTNSFPIGAASTAQLGVVFDATGLKLGIRRDKLTVKCLDCKKEKGCAQDKDELPVEVTVTMPAVPNQERTSAPDLSAEAMRPPRRCCENPMVDPCQCYGEDCYPGAICACANDQCVGCKLSQKSTNVHNSGVLRQFRDQVLNSTEKGRHYIRLYYFHSPAVTQVLLTEPVLAARTLLLTAHLVPGLQRWVRGSSKQSVVTANLITEIGGFSESLAAAAEKRGRPLLAADIRQEITPLTDIRLIGMTYPEAWKAINKERMPSPIHGQSDVPKFEISPQFSFLSLNKPTPIIGHTDVGGILGHQDPQDIIGHADNAGIGVRFTYNATRNVALEAVGNFIVGHADQQGIVGHSDNNGFQIQVGPKIGKRFENFGIFGKARPGIIHFSKVSRLIGTETFRSNAGLPATVVGVFSTESRTYFSTDVGGVVEYYPSRPIVIRFDLGDTIIQYGTRSGLSLSGTIIQLPAETKHNLQFSAGVGFRF